MKTREQIDERLIEGVENACAMIRLLSHFASPGARNAIAEETLKTHDLVEKLAWEPSTSIDGIFDLVLNTIDQRGGER